MDKIRSSRLTFKGDNKSQHKKSKKRHIDQDGNEIHKSGSTKRTKAVDEPLEGWVHCKTLEDVMGPVIIATSAMDPPSLLYKNQKGSNLSIAHLPPHNQSKDDPDQPLPTVTLSTIEPVSAIQVFIANCLPGSTKTTFKSAQDTYLASDKYGVVTCDMEAAGPAEEWELVVREDGFAFQNMHGLFLTAVAEDASVRADADSIGFKQVFTLKCQAAVKHAAAKKAKMAASPWAAAVAGSSSHTVSVGSGGIASLELQQLRRYQSYGERHVGLLDQDKKALINASKQGTINEELLNRRSKVKSDKFCK
ncbi:hypothetical protein BDV3_003215 [Batrachochytrium dendrobatidis]